MGLTISIEYSHIQPKYGNIPHNYVGPTNNAMCLNNVMEVNTYLKLHVYEPLAIPLREDVDFGTHNMSTLKYNF